MKKFLLSGLVLILAQAALAKDPIVITKANPISQYARIIKSSSGGFMMEDWTRVERCEVFPDAVIITKILGSLVKKETRTFTLSEPLDQTILTALNETTIKKANDLCDGPATSIVASYVDTTNNTLEYLTLYSTGGCGSDSIERQGPATSILVDLVNEYCPTTFKSFQ